MMSHVRTLLLLFIALFFVSKIHASTAGIIWHAGQATLWEGSILTGDVAYNWCAEAVQIRHRNGQISTFSSRQVREFGWFDYSMHKNRNFVSLSTSFKSEHPQLAFFEIFIDGQLPVIRRLDLPHGWLSRKLGHPKQYFDNPTLAQDTGLFTYFAYDEGQFLAVDHFYKEIYQPKLAMFDQELSRYSQVHNLNENTLLGKLMLINRYNFLAEENQKTASIKSENQFVE